MTIHWAYLIPVDAEYPDRTRTVSPVVAVLDADTPEIFMKTDAPADPEKVGR
jgi:hypothetical protein